LVKFGHKWSINPHSNKYLYPNMSNTLDGQYRRLKAEIADKYFVSISTVRTHIVNIYQKLHVHSRAQAVAKVTKSRV